MPPVALMFALTLADIVLMVLFRVVAPVILTLLSIVLGPGLRRAAARASETGRRISAQLALMRQGLAHAPAQDEAPAESRQPPRVRVAEEPEHELDERPVAPARSPNRRQE